MPKGFSAKREREYKEIERKLEKEHRYAGREEEVAARIVNKQRAQSGETKSSKRGSRKSGATSGKKSSSFSKKKSGGKTSSASRSRGGAKKSSSSRRKN